jgi:dTDP-4-dehydrorhamnose 3,5-epimerase
LLFTHGPVQGAFVINPERRVDERGYFARLWCVDELQAEGLLARIAQINTGVSLRKGTLRGMHFQTAPHQEVKVVRCMRGAVFDVVIDLRPDSSTYGNWMGVELTAENIKLMYVPEGCAHGYQTLADDTELIYLTSAPYSQGSANGVRFDDPSFAIKWPAPVTAISNQDKTWPDYNVRFKLTAE